MPSAVAFIIFAVGIAGLFFLDRDKNDRVSRALWVPTAWFFITASRPVSLWLGMAAPEDAASGLLEGSPLDRAVYAVLEAIALFVIISRRQRLGPILRKNWVIVLFFAYAALSISWSDFPLVTLKRWIKGIGDVMMVLIVLTEPSVAGAVRRLVTRVGFVLLPLSVLFIKYYPLLGRRLTLAWTMEPVGVGVTKNGLGHLCELFGLGLLWGFRNAYIHRKDPNSRRRLLAHGAVLATIPWLLWMCNSMTSICALSIASGVMLLSTRPSFRRSPALVHLLGAAALAVPLYALFFQSSGSFIQGLGRDPTLTGRTEDWPIILAIPNNRLVGTGYETFWLGSRLEKLWETFPGLEINQAHNGYIEMLLNLGWIGVALLGALIATGYRNVIGSYRRDPDVGCLRIALFLAIVITAFTEAAFRVMSPTWLVFLLATTDAPWMRQRKLSAPVASTDDLLESGQEPCAVHDTI